MSELASVRWRNDYRNAQAQDCSTWQTKFAALMSFGLTVSVLGEVLPLDNVLSVTSVRRWTDRTALRVEKDLIDARNVAAAAEVKI